MKHSVEEIKAVAEAALTTSQAATNAKVALEADPENEDLKTALADADRIAAEAQANVDALSHEEPDPAEKKKEKLLRKKGIINSELKKLGVDDDDDSEEDDEDDDSRPVTMGDLKRMQAKEVRKSTVQMVNDIMDVGDRTAVAEALQSVVPSNDPAADFRKAVGIANIDRNSKVLQEAARAVTPRTTRTATGAPSRREEPFAATPQEAALMRAPFNLTKEDILDVRKRGGPAE